MKQSNLSHRLFLSLFFVFIVAASIGVVYVARSHNPSVADRAFTAQADLYFDQFYLPHNPSTATALGIHAYDDKLEDLSLAGIKSTIRELHYYEKMFLAIDDKQLSEQMQGDRNLILNNIRSTLLTLETIKPWEKNPDIYSSTITNSAFVLMSRQFAPLDDRLRLLIAREKSMPHLLEQAHKNIKNPPKIYTSIAIEQLPGMIRFFEKDVPAAFSGSTDQSLKDEFTKTNKEVIAALKKYQSWLQKSVLSHSHGDFRIGKETFRRKLMYDEMVDEPLEKLLAINMANMRENQKEFIRVAKEIDPAKTPGQVYASLTAHHPAPDKLLDTFAGEFTDLIRFIETKNIITIPSDVRPIMEETPPFMRAITFASMDTPGPYEKVADEAYFNVTLPEPSWSKSRISEFMSQFNYSAISSVAVHETYPGHYVQFLWVRNIHDRVRKLLGANTNVEGWAHYCEQMILDEGFGKNGFGGKSKLDADKLRLGQLQEALLRNARFVAGIEMHTGKMSFNQAVDFFVKEGMQSRMVGTVETKRGTSDPTYLYYTLGKLEILKLRKDMENKLGKSFDLKKFHNDFMRQGYPPIKIVRKAMLGNDSPAI